MNRVLIVEGDPAIASLYVELLAREGVTAEAVASPEQAAVLVDQKPVALVVLDVDLPEKIGPKIAWAIREKGHHLPILGLLDARGDWDPDDLGDLGFTRLLSKPVEGTVLLQNVRELVSAPPHSREAAS